MEENTSRDVTASIILQLQIFDNQQCFSEDTPPSHIIHVGSGLPLVSRDLQTSESGSGSGVSGELYT